MSNTFFIGDLHFGHKNIIKFSRQQFNTIEEHNEKLVENWNSVVKKNDTVWILGDLAFGVANLRLYVGQLSGRKKLVLGNHDDPRTSIYGDVSISKLYGAAYFGEGILTHIPVHSSQLDTRFKFNIHGHLHNGQYIDMGHEYNYYPDNQYINVNADSINLTPKAWEDIRKEYNV